MGMGTAGIPLVPMGIGREMLLGMEMEWELVMGMGFAFSQ